MKLARAFLIFSYGLFAIAAQALLFREFITTFEGNDISVGIFFGSWFCWIALGAALINKAKTIADKLLYNIEFVLLVFLPAFMLEWILIIQAREIAGIQSYTLWSVRDILLLSLLINAPVSMITGVFFPIACRWVRQDGELAVSRVYIIEAAGSFVGGLGVTVLLGLGMSSARIFFVLALVLSSSALCVQLVQAPQEGKVRNLAWRAIALSIPACVLICLGVRADETVMRYIRVIKWTKLLPKQALVGSFQTPQAEYLYGRYQDQWIAVREGSTCEVLPDHESAGRIAAISLCQKPDAKTVLVVGSGLGLCQEFLRLRQIETISWAHCDSEYLQKVDRFIPAEFRISDQRFHRLAADVRALLAEKRNYYDILIINLPEATSSVLNRYYSLEFYRQIKESLKPDGVLAVRVAGGENIMGTELVNLGASTKLTLEQVFSKLALTPGEDTWFIASDSGNLTGEPGILRDRFAAIPGANRVFSPQALLSIYLPDRADAALASYSATDLPDSMLINRDSRPLTHLYSLLLAAKQSGAPVTRVVKRLVLAGPLAYLVPILVFVALRILYIIREAQSGQAGASGFDSMFLIFSAGLIGIGAVIVLMYLYQTRFGSLYLHIGIISSLFMVGLTGGAAGISQLLNRRSGSGSGPVMFVVMVLIAHALILAAISFWPAEQQTHTFFAIAFVVCGLAAGCYFPLAAKQLADAGVETGRIGSKLETADHIGAAAGGLLTGLALVPVLGANATLVVFIVLILANLPPIAVTAYKPAGRESGISDFGLRLRRLGYALFGVGVSVILCSNLLAEAGAQLRPSLPQYAAHALAGRSRLEQASKVLADSGRKTNYFEVYDANNVPTGYIFSSEDLAPQVRGFGGRINLAVYVDPNGTLIDFHVISSNETPAYLDLLNRRDTNDVTWLDRLKGRRLFQPEPFADVDAVTGATVSSEAILAAMQTSGHRFAIQVLGRSVETTATGRIYQAKYSPDKHAVYLIGAFVLALIVIYRGGFWSRLAVLLLNLVVGGIWLNAQFSSEQMATLLSFHAPTAALTGVFLLIIAVPLSVALFGNIYCGYICPFGAAQELLGHVIPRKFKPSITTDKMRLPRFVKYAVLFILILVFFFSRKHTTLRVDLLISVWRPHFWGESLLVVVAIALIGSALYSRFWCRYLCPAGAFLSLLNKAAILKRYLPAKRFGFCEFGITAKDQLDCLYCDRCRYLPEAALKQISAGRDDRAAAPALARYFVVGVLAAGTLISAIAVRRFMQVIPAGMERQAAFVSSAGQIRDVDLQRIRTMIEQKRLSDREAEFYKKIE
jgi:predicted membrane-bound spermidine synthase/Na+-translocating ferredoxin:NAD+ oxidoreductase RnfG subunit